MGRGGDVIIGASGPTEDTVLALLELLVDPLLPSVSSFARGRAPSPAEEESVAKQVQAVVLLYDYYHRKHNPELEYLDFVSFCKLAVFLKPSLLLYMKVTQNADCTEVEDLDKQLSLTEKMIMEACDVSKNLYMSKGGVKGWPIAKVAVFLVDFSKKHCFLLHSSNTQGVWSVIEKEHSLNLRVEGMIEEKAGNRKKRITKKPLKSQKENRTVDENGLQQLAIAAVKGACGCNQSDLKILGSHTVYNLSKVKTAARFYIMQCEQSNQEGNYVPIRDVLDSLQGPLVRKESSSWSTTSVVEYFHLLPYADILSDWFSREAPLKASHETGIKQENRVHLPTDSTLEDNEREQYQKDSVSNEVSVPCNMIQEEDLEAQNCNTGTEANTSKTIDGGQDIYVCNRATTVDTSVHIGQGLETENQSKEALQKTSCSGSKSENSKGAERVEEPVETVVYKKRNKSLNRDRTGEDAGCKLSKFGAECSMQKDSEFSVSGLSNNMEIDELVPAVSSADGKNRSCSGEDHVINEMKTIVLSHNSLPSLTTDAVVKEEIVDTTPSNHERNGENMNTEVKAASSCQDGVQRNALIPFHSNSEDFDKIHNVLSSRENLISQTALKVLRKKRDMLSYQLRSIEDEIAVCDRNIQTILRGGEDDLAVKLDSIIEGCNFVNLSGGGCAHEGMYQCLQDQDSLKYLKRKRLCEANLSMKDPCQEVDDICYEKGWTLPTYNISASDGGFQSAVTVKGVDFECSHTGDLYDTPSKARESAASSMLAELRGMASASSGQNQSCM